MQFSVTKEVDWEADDEADNPKPEKCLKKRYRFTIDFSRRSSKAKGKKSKKAAPSNNKAEAEEEQNSNSNPLQHLCYGCDQPRSPSYHHQYPIKPGKQPRPSLCTQCRFFRTARIRSRARDGGRRRRVTESEARVDDREWCASCGTLRSNEYHAKLLSGELPPWNEICGHCMMRVEEKNKIRRLRVYYEEMDVAGWADDDERRDPLRDSLQNRRSSPYAFTPTSSREEMRVDSPVTSAQGRATSGSSGLSSVGSSPVLVSAPEYSTSSSGASKDRETRRRHDCQAACHLPRKGESDGMKSHTRGQPGAGPATSQADPGNIKHRQESREPGMARQQETSRGPRERPKTPAPAATSSTADGTGQWQDVPELSRAYLKPGHLQKPREEKLAKPESREKSASVPAPVPANLGNGKQRQEPQEARENHHPPHGYRREMPKPVNALPQPSEPFYYRNGHTTGKAPPQAEQQPQYQSQPQQEPLHQQQPPKPMGISDMYWASEEGKAEQTFTAGGYFFPGFATAYIFQQDEEDGGNNSKRCASEQRARNYNHGTFHTAAASEQHNHHATTTTAAQIWEVDSDEADEIEEGHVNLLAGKGKARSRAGKKM